VALAVTAFAGQVQSSTLRLVREGRQAKAWDSELVDAIDVSSCRKRRFQQRTVKSERADGALRQGIEGASIVRESSDLMQELGIEPPEPNYA
jgi:hypothetical protein